MIAVLRGVMSPALGFGSALLIAVILPSLFGWMVWDLEKARIAAAGLNLPPSMDHPLGTQSEGRDVLALLLIGTPATLKIGAIGGGVGVILGLVLGLISGYFGGKIDTVIRNVVDVGLTIPPFAVLIMIAASFRVVSIEMMGLAVALSTWMYPTRIIRSQVLSLRSRGYVRMAKLSGVGSFGIIFGEIMPNLLPILSAAAVNAISVAILASIGLEVLGLGSGGQTLGTTMYFAIYYAAMWRGMWWWWLPPIVILIIIFLGLFLVSASLDTFANPKLRGAAG